MTGLQSTQPETGLVCATDDDAATVESTLEQALAASLGKSVFVHARTAVELQRILDEDPFQAAEGKFVHFALYRDPPGAVPAQGPTGEQLVVVGRDLVVHYANGVARSKLKLPRPSEATARNRNTMRKMLALLSPG